jgi:SAM-dependent methyltransferase
MRRTLHFAPETRIAERLASCLVGQYITVDLEPKYDVALDITNLPFDTGAYDLVVCCHVLEHIPDDRTAIAELHRVLAPGGQAVIQVPVRWDGGPTEEDPSLSPEERTKRFGQSDHVRLYGPDLAERLRDAGFSVSVYTANDCLGEDCIQMAITPSQPIFVAAKS